METSPGQSWANTDSSVSVVTHLPANLWSSRPRLKSVPRAAPTLNAAAVAVFLGPPDGPRSEGAETLAINSMMARLLCSIGLGRGPSQCQAGLREAARVSYRRRHLRFQSHRSPSAEVCILGWGVRRQIITLFCLLWTKFLLSD